ncbi:YebC/PmpR family DNA-binding transcriptional regulator [Acanthopleuribacter pedis]|uniref:Probable transcriptional regulatory protein J3U88_03645 n=1 Tax=Acanthopleuribacter pedis TaxID=442870 RepID=A0A8J7U3R6_9BACT|nr:YebC/PmpR family DNA-binding transcriptional regulator [Acanthopleuribacter pedis]MBO1317541.1 YebC/PmpR family DNA-binding transcriptional regulator [Acanthopleuribacter pedis]
MAGHSKWANIQHRKSRQDSKRAKVFTKMAKEITVAAKMGGPDPDANPRLRAAIAAARKISMPGDNIKRAIDKSTAADAATLEEIHYEGYGPAGTAFIVECLTDNRNRTAGEIRSIFSKAGGNMGESGSVAWQFDKKGYLTSPKGERSEDDVTEICLEVGGEDIEDGGEFWAFISAPEDLHAVRDALEEQGLEVESAKWEMLPQNHIQVEGETLEKVMRLMEKLDDCDDVQNVWNNADFDEAALS